MDKLKDRSIPSIWRSCWANIKKHSTILWIWAFLAGKTIWSGTALYLVLLCVPLVLAFAVWGIYVLVRLVAAKPVRFEKDLGIRVAILIVAIASLVGICKLQAEAAQSHADAVLAKILSHKAQYSVYPKSLDEVGLSTAEEKNRFHLFYYSDGVEHPSIFYQSTGLPFDRYWYDFEHGIWEFHPD